MKNIHPLTWFVLLLLVLAARQAHAYLDPATGSMALQAILAIVAAVLISVKAFWHRIRGFFGGGDSSAEPSDVDDES
jgi:hypothetical protein